MKKYIILGLSFLILLAAAFFSYVIFSKKKTIKIVVQNPIAEIAEEENSDTQNREQEAQENSAVESEPEKTDTKSEITENKKTVTEDAKNNEIISQEENTEKIIDRFVSWGFEKSTSRKIDTIIMHSSYDALGDDPYDVDGLIAEYKQYGVAAHYLIARDGKIYHLVADKNIAYHAGESRVPDGRTGVNTFSIGIEMMNKEDGKFTSAQYAALNHLIGDLKKQYSIKYILGHSDIAPGRKTDPWGIDWTKVQK